MWGSGGNNRASCDGLSLFLERFPSRKLHFFLKEYFGPQTSHVPTRQEARWPPRDLLSKTETWTQLRARENTVTLNPDKVERLQHFTSWSANGEQKGGDVYRFSSEDRWAFWDGEWERGGGASKTVCAHWLAGSKPCLWAYSRMAL